MATSGNSGSVNSNLLRLQQLVNALYSRSNSEPHHLAYSGDVS